MSRYSNFQFAIDLVVVSAIIAADLVLSGLRRLFTV